MVHAFSYQSTPVGGNPVLWWDGRIHNRVDVVARLRLSDADRFADERLASFCYERWGLGGLGMLIGDWSVVLRDRDRDGVVFARDFAGVRPLYLHTAGESIRWSSSLADLVAATGVTVLDEAYVAGFLLLGGAPNRTPYRDIASVPPGRALYVTKGDCTSHEFWTLEKVRPIRYRTDGEYVEHLRALVREAVSTRLAVPGAAAAELSGGLDSSSVVCMANDLIRRGRVAATSLSTISYCHADSIDAPFMRAVERASGNESNHIWTKESPMFCHRVPAGATPLDSSPLVHSAAAALRRRSATVCLTGQSGDLVFGNWIDDSSQVAGHLRRGRISQACREAWAWSVAAKLPVFQVMWQAATQTVAPWSWRSRPIHPSLRGPVPDVFTSAFAKRDPFEAVLSGFSKDWRHAPLERRSHHQMLTMTRELGTLQPPEVLTGCGYTHPLLHRPLVEFLMAIPADQLCRPGEPRRLMRKALASMWPESLRRRRSKGLFGRPNLEAFQPLALQILRDRRCQVVDRGWLSHERFFAMLRRFAAGVEANTATIRQALLLENWLRHRFSEP